MSHIQSEKTYHRKEYYNNGNLFFRSYNHVLPLPKQPPWIPQSTPTLIAAEPDAANGYFLQFTPDIV
jgi:hypothetical protein